MLWEVVFMLLVLKIPVVYLCGVVWWAIKAEPEPLDATPVRSLPAPEPRCDWRRPRPFFSGRGPVPRGGRSAQPARGALARARAAG